MLNSLVVIIVVYKNLNLQNVLQIVFRFLKNIQFLPKGKFILLK